MPIVDLRDISTRQLEPLLKEEQSFWLDELHWDYRLSTQLIRKFVDGHSLTGCALLQDDRVAGYGFYVLEDSKGLIGGTFASSTNVTADDVSQLLNGIVESLLANEQVRRVETQLMCFGNSLNATLRERGFALYDRYFMLLPLKVAPSDAAPVPEGLRMERWDDRYFEATARLIQAAYQGHIDADINDQYRSEAGALKFLKNIVILPGCGEFQPYASFVVRSENAKSSDPLVAAILASTVSMGVGHITQVCIVPEFRGRGLGLRLMEASMQALRSRRYHALSLTVTAANENAVRLYDRMGFKKLRTFTAAVWEK
jgi:ribosomal protein S18 acetylase RimI-like enzyme